MAFVNMEIPEEMVSFVIQPDKDEQLKRNAGMLSFRKTTELFCLFPSYPFG